ncbi:MAG: hypothetical protein JWR21_814 [Herminiimonas sp.]|nr:hypothetical protein [Herminiimonas sp.]
MEDRLHSRAGFIFVHLFFVVVVSLIMMQMAVGAPIAGKLHVGVGLLPALIAAAIARRYPRLAVTCLISAGVATALSPFTPFIALLISLFFFGLHM